MKNMYRRLVWFTLCRFWMFVCLKKLMFWLIKFVIFDTVVFSRNQMVVQKLIVTTIMGVVFGYFIGVSFPSISLTKVASKSWILIYYIQKHIFIWFDCNILQVIIPSSIYSPFDVTMQSKSLERSFPENLGSGIYSVWMII